jgi:CubicO group peptidase (beta-lactamase class C family)
MTSLAALVLVDRDELVLDADVAKYWPEFAANGKEAIKGRHLLSHTSGVSGWDQPVSIDDVYDSDRSTAMLAAQAPWWGPGTGPGYHALTYGHLIGEVIRRITGRRLGEFLAAHIAVPLGADFHIGLSPSGSHRVSDLVPWPPQPIDLTRLDPDGPAYKTVTGPDLSLNIERGRTGRWRRADIGAANGHGNARSIVRIQSAVAYGGEVAGVRLLSPRTIDRTFEVQGHAVDLVLGIPLKIGVGHGLPWPEVLPFAPGGRVCFGTGAGGSLVIADADRRLTVACVMNELVPSVIVGPIAAALVERVYAIVTG